MFVLFLLTNLVAFCIGFGCCLSCVALAWGVHVYHVERARLARRATLQVLPGGKEARS